MKRLALAIASVAVTAAAHATDLVGTLTADNFFTAYISTDDSATGTEIGSAHNWFSPVDISTALTPGVTNYLHIVAGNDGGPSMFFGEFSLSDGGFMFLNGTQSALTNTTDWKGNLTGFGNAYSTPIDLGAEGTSPWGSFSNIDDNARFIWMNPDNGSLALNYFTLEIRPVPEPGTMAALGLGAAALIARRRRAK